MNKKKISITLASLALASGVLVGCKNDKGEAKTVTNVQLKGVFTAYAPDEAIDWSKVSILITYSDNSTATISASDIEFDVESAVNANTKAILSTNGLHGAVLPTEKDYAMSVKLISENKQFNAGSISVDSITPAKYSLETFIEPEFVSVYESAKENAGNTTETDKAKLETYFKKGDDMLTVGTMNTFKFIPEVTFTKNGGSLLDGALKMSNSYKKTVTVEEYVSSEYQAASTEDYEVVREGIKFADSAIGKQFKLTVKPEEFTVPNPAVVEFKVEKGVNIYSAKEMGVLNLTSLTPEANNGPIFYENTFGAGGVDNGNNPIFYNGTSKKYERADSLKMWKDFLLDSGTYTNEEIAAYTDAPGYFILNNITVEASDIPSEFFITSAESEKYAGSLRDGALLYHIISNVEKTINGNYFNLDTSRIPLCMSTANGDGLKILSSSDSTVNPGHAIVFYVPGQHDRTDNNSNDEYLQTNTFKEGVKKVVFKNINTIGNTGNDLGHTKIEEEDENFKKMAKLTGLVAFKAGTAPVTVDNVIVKQYMIGAMANYTLAGNGSEAPTQLLNSRIYDCANAGAFNYECQNFLIKNTEMKRFGGAAIFNACDKDRAYRGGYTNVTSDCVIENYVTGQEVYFTAVGAAGAIGTLKALNAFFSLPFAEKPFIKKVGDTELLNVISLTMEDGYMGSSERTFYGGTRLNVEGDWTCIDLGENRSFGGIAYSMVNGLLGMYAPVVTFDGSITINPGTGNVQMAGDEIAAVLVFNPNDPTSQGIVIPADKGLGDDYGPGVYVPLIPDMSAKPIVVAGLTNALAYEGNNMHIVVPLGETTLSLIFGV